MHRRLVLRWKVIGEALDNLRSYVEREDYAGYDPYDALMGRVDFRRFGKWGPVLAIQVLKRLPFNVRPLLGIKKGRNPKGMGLLLSAYSILYRVNPDDETLRRMREIFPLAPRQQLRRLFRTVLGL